MPIPHNNLFWYSQKAKGKSCTCCLNIKSIFVPFSFNLNKHILHSVKEGCDNWIKLFTVPIIKDSLFSLFTLLFFFSSSNSNFEFNIHKFAEIAASLFSNSIKSKFSSMFLGSIILIQLPQFPLFKYGFIFSQILN